MTEAKPKARIQHILCPTDLTGKSQKALGFATRLADHLEAHLTACHCALANWFTQENHLPADEYKRIKTEIKNQVTKSQSDSSRLTWRSLVIENSFDPARDILAIARETEADLIVMKARPSVLSAFRFGSLVERVIEGARCPVLLLPSSFLAGQDPSEKPLEFQKILFDYDFSDATDDLFHVVNALSKDFDAELRMLSVLETTGPATTEAAPLPFSRTGVQTFLRSKINDVLESEGRSIMDVPTAIEWGRHAETLLQYAESHKIDLICTALTPPHFYFEKLYRGYLGSLLRSAQCPILVKQSLGTEKVKSF
jgi:nucleotide-binding universal stress UspA family protein